MYNLQDLIKDAATDVDLQSLAQDANHILMGGVWGFVLMFCILGFLLGIDPTGPHLIVALISLVLGIWSLYLVGFHIVALWKLYQNSKPLNSEESARFLVFAGEFETKTRTRAISGEFNTVKFEDTEFGRHFFAIRKEFRQHDMTRDELESFNAWLRDLYLEAQNESQPDTSPYIDDTDFDRPSVEEFKKWRANRASRISTTSDANTSPKRLM